MARTCPECGEILTNLGVCPNCGYEADTWDIDDEDTWCLLDDC